MDKSVLYMIIPCYNEEEVLPVMAPVFLEKIKSLIKSGKIHNESRILFIDDGSKDSTWEMIKKLAQEDLHFIGISQSRNRGHQNAVWAGLMEAKDHCDITISIDCDGQDDLNAMDEMIAQYCNGYEIVYGVRSNRDTDAFFKRFSAESFYKLLNWMGAEVVYNHADYRLVSGRALQELAKFREVNLYLRGLIPLVGFASTCVFYERHERAAGYSHYPLSKMLSLAFDGITSLSVKPIKLIINFGVLVSACSAAGMLWAVIVYLLGSSNAAWIGVVSLICFLAGVQFMSIGMIGEYIGKVYMETKARPRYIICARTSDYDKTHVCKGGGERERMTGKLCFG